MADLKQIRVLMQGPAAWNVWRRSNTDVKVKLKAADLSGFNLVGADLTGADLSYANLSQADLSGAELVGAILTHASLSCANLRGADLDCADLSQAKLDGANVSGAFFESTVLFAVDLSRTIGLETVKHSGPSNVGLDTFFRSKGKIPEVFLRKAGAPAILLNHAGPIADEPVRSCLG